MPSYNTEPQFVRVNGVLQVFWDEQGRPYYKTTSGQRHYIDPRQAAQGDPNAPPGSQAARLQEWARSQGVNVTRNDTGGASMTNPTGWSDTNWANTRTVWNPETGRFERDIDRTFLATLAGAGGVIGAGVAAAAAGGGAVAGGAPLATTAPTAAGAGGAGTAAGTTAGTAAGFTPTVLAPATLGGAPMFAAGTTAALPAALTPTTAALIAGGAGAVPALASLGGGDPYAEPPASQGLSELPGTQLPAESTPGSSTLPGGTNPTFQNNNTQAPGGGPQQASANPYKDFFDKYGEDIGEFAGGLGEGAGDERTNENLFNRSRDSVLAQIARDQALFDLQNAQSTFDRNLQGAESLYDRNRLQQRDIFSAGMDTAGFARENQSREMRQAMLSGLIGGAEDFKVTGMNPKIAERMPTSTGGARPSMFAGSRDSILATLGRPQVQAPTYTPPPGFAAPGPYVPPGGYKPPTLTEYEGPGKLETGFNWGGAISKLKPWKWF